MPNDISTETFTIKEAESATGCSPRALRNWVDRKQVYLDAEQDRDDQTWRRFSLLDVTRFALVGRLVACGVSVQRASEIIEDHLGGTFKLLGSYKNTPAGALVAGLKGRPIIAVPGDDGAWKTIDESEISDSFPAAFVKVNTALVAAKVIQVLEMNRDLENRRRGGGA